MAKQLTTTKLTATEAQKTTKIIRKAFLVADEAVADLRARVHDFDKRGGPTAMGFKSFNKWAESCMPWEKTRCYDLLTEARVEARITAFAPVEGDIPSDHLVTINRVKEDRQAFTYQKAVDLANVNNDGDTVKPARRHIRAAVKQVMSETTPTDRRGTTVSNEELAEVLTEASAFDALLSVLGRLKTSIFELAQSLAGAVLEGELDSIERHRQEIYRLVRFSRPFAECLYCRGTGKASGKTCRACKGRMWLTEAQMKQAPKETQRSEPIPVTSP